LSKLQKPKFNLALFYVERQLQKYKSKKKHFFAIFIWILGRDKMNAKNDTNEGKNKVTWLHYSTNILRPLFKSSVSFVRKLQDIKILGDQQQLHLLIYQSLSFVQKIKKMHNIC